ncbi:protoglobin domain-containing protein [Thermocrinis minervae]|uniref:Uncharacterized membrane protein, DUF373 family n=1 Tax=Thermocrinis minervae TaxID=381751 RepID=A0A1M6R824_9AQUI|nr:protoglobin domain-containing protein [Thermocrinis minervae]SHK28625.1 Uncharacterized membrane protein, DUF373 family [Thermocrinis minervae]
MESIEELKVHYRWTAEDEENLRKVSKYFEEHAEEFMDEFYRYLENFPDTSKYLPSQEVRKRHREKVKDWFISLFSSRYDASYLRRLYRIGETHVKIGLPPHYVNASMNFVREYIGKKLTELYGCSEERDRILSSVNKALDLNLDVMVSSFREEELKLYLGSGKYTRVVIETLRRISWFFDAFIVLSLTVVGMFLIYWVVYEILLAFSGTYTLEKLGISILGSLLVLYAVSELLYEEIKHIRGGSISISVFVGVALAAIIRKILIVSLTPEKVYELITLGFVVLALGLVYLIVRKVETKT